MAKRDLLLDVCVGDYPAIHTQVVTAQFKLAYSYQFENQENEPILSAQRALAKQVREAYKKKGADIGFVDFNKISRRKCAGGDQCWVHKELVEKELREMEYAAINMSANLNRAHQQGKFF